MARPLPPNIPTSMTGTDIIDWICENEKFGYVYPNDYEVGGAAATEILDLSKVYSIVSVPRNPTTGSIPQDGTGNPVSAIEVTTEVAARLSSGGAIANEQIAAMVDNWLANPQTPRALIILDIINLIDSGKVTF